MRTLFIVGMILAFFVGGLISQTIDYQNSYMNPDSHNMFVLLLEPEFVTGGSIPVIGFFVIAWEWLQAIWVALSWDYSFFTGYWEILRYVGWCFSIGFIVSLVLAVRGTGSS